MARTLFANENPVGRTISFGLGPGQQSPPYSVIGVAADVKNSGLAAPADAEYYVPRKRILDPNAGRGASLVARALHQYDGEAFVIVRGNLPAEVASRWIRAAVAELDPSVPAVISPMPERLRQVSERPRFSAALLSLFALVGVLLAAAGLYGLMSFLVARRTQEVGVRMALGATPTQVGRLVLGHALRWSVLGIAIGVAGSVASGSVLRSLLYQVPANDPVLIGGAAALLLVVAIAATLLPSLRAARIDPVVALRQE
jgi:hypothetical protein